SPPWTHWFGSSAGVVNPETATVSAGRERSPAQRPHLHLAKPRGVQLIALRAQAEAMHVPVRLVPRPLHGVLLPGGLRHRLDLPEGEETALAAAGADQPAVGVERQAVDQPFLALRRAGKTPLRLAPVPHLDRRRAAQAVHVADLADAP